MCAYSMISGHFQDKWPGPEQYPLGARLVPWHEYQELARKAREYDKMTGQPDCPDPKKEQWEKVMEDFLRKKGLLQ